jgi:hypothetical protein
MDEQNNRDVTIAGNSTVSSGDRRSGLSLAQENLVFCVIGSLGKEVVKSTLL